MLPELLFADEEEEWGVHKDDEGGKGSELELEAGRL
jgi:hypothetical protein